MQTRNGSSEYLKLLGYRRFHYRWWPSASKRRLVLLHGLGESADTWAPLASRLSGAAEVIAPDLRGHGGTPWDPDRNYSFEDYLDDLRLQLAHWSVSSTLAGAGLGGRLALSAALELPDLVEAVVLIGPDAAIEQGKTLTELLCEAYRPGFGEAIDGLGPFAGPRWRSIYQELTWAKPGGGRTPRCDPAALAGSGGDGFSGDPPQVRQPVLAAEGNASGAWAHITAPVEVAEAVRTFLDEAAGGASRGWGRPG